MYNYNCPICEETKIQSDKNTRKINEVIEQVNKLTPLYNETESLIAQKSEEKVEEVANLKVPVIANNFLNEFKENFYKNNVDISLLPNYNKDDISVVLNSITFEPNTRYFLNDGDLINRNLIQIELPTGAKLEISGTITSYSSFMELRTSLKGSYIKLDTIIASEENKFDKGIHFIKGAMSKLEVNVIKGFKNSLLLKPLNAPLDNNFNASDWLQYNKIDFMEISGDIAISLICSFQNTWINENTFNGGGLGGRINILMKKDFNELELKSIINNNKFYNLGVHSSEEAIKIEENSGEQNYFLNLRMQEQAYNKEGLDINDKGTQNYYQCMWAMPIETIKLGKKSKYDGELYSRVWDSNLNKFPSVGVGAIGDMDLTKRMHIIKFDNGLSVSFILNEFKLNSCHPYIRCGMNNGEISNLRIQEHLFFDGNIFMLSKLGYSNSTINLFSAGGKKLAITDNGLYQIYLTENKDYFEVYKLANTDPSSPS